MQPEFAKIVILFFKIHCAIVIFRPPVAPGPQRIWGVKPGRRALENNSAWRQGRRHLMPVRGKKFRQGLLGSIQGSD